MRTITVICTTIFFFALLSSARSEQNNQQLLERARALLKTTPLIDGHNDVPWTLRDKFKSDFSLAELSKDTSKLDPPMHTDIARLRQGGVGAQFWSVYVPVETEAADAVHAVLEQMDLVHQMIERYPDAFEFAGSADDITRIHRNGKIASLIGIEGGHSINNSLAVLRELYRCGARYMTLTHSKNTTWADSATDEPKNQGLSKFGELIVREMNWLGMLVDLSHVSPDTMNDVLDIAAAPVIFSHSTARAIGAHQRNVPDQVLKRLSTNGGVVMVDFVPSFVSEKAREYESQKQAEEARLKVYHPDNPAKVETELKAWEQRNPHPRATVEQVVDHIDHIRKTAGIEHIGIGSDFDGISTTPIGLEDVSKFPALVAELLRRGYADEDVKKIVGLNVIRVMKTVETVAGKLRKERQASPARFETKEPEKVAY